MRERKFYRINDLSPLLDGMIVESFQEDPPDDPLVKVSRFIDPAVNVGDHLVSLPVADCGLYIDELHLEEVDDPTAREFASDNPFGKLVKELSTARDGVSVAMHLFEKSLSVSVRQSGGVVAKSLYSQNFSGNLEEKWRLMSEQLSSGDIEEFVFFLKDLKEKELHGEA